MGIETTLVLSTQMALLHLIEKWKSMLDRKGYVAGILMDLSKAFGKINHELLVEKRYAYEIRKEALKLIFSYLNNRKQGVKINKTFIF